MIEPLTFQSVDTDFELSNISLIKEWINKIIQQESGKLSFINFIFCNDAYLLTLNQEYLDHDTFTDIITFDYNTNQIESDIFISVERVEENATLHSTTFQNELHRVIIHGTLHLLGYKDKSKTEKELMRSKENEALNLLISTL